MKKLFIGTIVLLFMLPAMAHPAGPDVAKTHRIEILVERLQRFQFEGAFYQEKLKNLKIMIQATQAELSKLKTFVVDTSKPPESATTPTAKPKE